MAVCTANGFACNADLERASELAGALGIGSISTHLSAIRGFLELGLGHAQAAIEQLEPIRRMVEDHRLGEPGMVPWRPDLIEACARAGDRTRALTELDVLELEAQQSENIWARGAVARLRGLLQDRGHVDDNFALALECHPPMVSPFEWARTRLCHGERMRRDRPPDKPPRRPVPQCHGDSPRTQPLRRFACLLYLRIAPRMSAVRGP